MKKETKVMCPECGAEFAVPGKGLTDAVATVLVDNPGTGVLYPVVVKRQAPVRTAQERIEALRKAGVDVSNLFAMNGANGGEYIASNSDGKLTILSDDDPIFEYISEKGTVPNRRLFRRFIMAQMFHMMTEVPYGERDPVGVTKMIHCLGYEYQWKMLLDELYAQKKMEGRDAENFGDRNRWFNREVVSVMAEDYVAKLKTRLDSLSVKKCKGILYKRIGSRDIFVEDLYTKLYNPLYSALSHIEKADSATELFYATKKFNDLRIKLPHETPQNKKWIDAYKGAGAYFTMQNLIRFHGCTVVDDDEKRLNKYQSLDYLSAKAEAYKDGGGWRLLAMLKKLLADNGIDPQRKINEWKKKS